MKCNHTSLKLRMTRSLFLSIALLASFAGVRAMTIQTNADNTTVITPPAITITQPNGVTFLSQNNVTFIKALLIASSNENNPLSQNFYNAIQNFATEVGMPQEVIDSLNNALATFNNVNLCIIIANTNSNQIILEENLTETEHGYLSLGFLGDQPEILTACNTLINSQNQTNNNQNPNNQE